MKKILALALAVIMVLGMAAVAAGEAKTITVSPMTMSINGEAVTPLKSDGTPAEVFAYDGATYVPLRYLAELLGIEVGWDPENPNVAALVGDITLPAGPQTVTGEGQGFGGLITATLTVDGGKIVDVVLAGAAETPAIGGAALEELADQVKAASGADIDGVSGATFTSNGVKEAVAAALAKAAGETASSAMKAGRYEGVGTGHRGSEVVVSVLVDETSILEVEVKSHGETYGVGWGLPTSPVEALPKAIVADQTVNVDSVTSATVTSAAIKAAVTDCLTQAGADLSKFRGEPTRNTADETYDVDVVVVGYGAAGTATALAAQEAGLNVLVMEKAGVSGGSGARSGGKVLAAGTDIQKEQGIEDNADMMYEYLMSFDRDQIMNAALVKQFCDASLDNFNWLVERGATFRAVADNDPEQGKFAVEPIHSALNPWRVHNAKGGGGQTDGHGGQITAPLTNAYAEKGGKVVYECAAKELLVDAGGAVVGVVGEKTHGGKVTVNAKNVILCTGGYCHNEEMLEAYRAFLPTNKNSGVPMTDTGDGINMAKAIGAKSTTAPGLQLVYVNYDCYCGINEESGLVVAINGSRVVNEWSYQSHVAQALADAKSPVGYYITATKGGVCAEPYPMIQWGTHMELNYSVKADSLEGLAEQTYMDADTLKATVARYNELCAKGSDDDFGKPAEYMIPVEGDTYFAFPMYPGSSATFGGLEINDKSQVLKEDGSAISGLYAAGEVAFTGLFDAEYPCCGMAIGSGIFFGRNAVQVIAGK